jgi:hypothetical protein
MKQAPYHETTIIRCHCTKFGHPNDQAPRIFIPWLKSIYEYNDTKVRVDMCPF